MHSPFRIALIFIAVACLSLAAIPYLQIDLLPKGYARKLELRFTVRQAAPEIVEQQATAILEGVCAQLPGLVRIESVSGYNQGRITLEFGTKADLDALRFELAALLRQIYPRLPEGISYPEISRIGGESASARQGPFMVYTIESPEAPFQVRKTAEALFRKSLAGEKSLRQVDFSGVSPLQLNVRYDLQKLRALGVHAAVLQQALRQRLEVPYPGIASDGKGHAFFLRLSQLPASIEALENLSIALPDGGSVLLKKLAQLHIEEAEPEQYFRINGKSAVRMNLFAREGENTLLLAKRLRGAIPEIAAQLPAGYTARLEYDNTEYLSRELDKTMQRTALSMAILVAFILLAYREWQSLLTLLVGLAVNLGLTLLLIWALGVEIHLYTLAGLAIAFGLMIDNAVVMLDYYREYRQRQVFTALLGATFTTMAALGLIFLLPPEERANLQDFAAAVCLSLGASLAVALGFIPGMYALLKPRPDQTAKCNFRPKRWQVKLFNRYNSLIEWGLRRRWLYLGAWTLAFGLPIFLLPAKIDGWKHYNATIGSERYQERIRPIVDQYTGGALRLFVRKVFERSGYRTPERTRLFVRAQLPHGATPQQMDFLLQRMEELLEGVEGIDTYTTNTYSGEQGGIEISFLPAFERSALPYVLRSRLIARSTDWSGVNWSVYGVGQGFGTGAGGDIPSYRVQLLGYNYDQLDFWAERLRQLLEMHPRVQNVNTDAILEYGERAAYAYRMELNRDQLSGRGVAPGTLYAALQEQSAPQGPVLRGQIGKEYLPVRLASAGSEDYSTFDLLQSPLPLDSLRTLRPGELATLIREKTAPGIYRQDRRYVRMVSFEYTGSYIFGGKFLNETLAGLNLELPPGYEAVRDRYEFWRGKQARRRGLLLLALLVGNFFICSILFESFRKPLAVIAVIPLSLIGLFLTFAWGKFYFDQGGYAAMVLLGGISVNAAIFVLLDYRRHPMRERRPLRALLLALIRRARTILLTILSTICGLIPFLSGGDAEVFWFALAAGATGGLLFSLPVVFLALPVLAGEGASRLPLSPSRCT